MPNIENAEIEKIEFKQVELVEFKALSEDGEFEGYASIFNNVDLGGDKILPGAFAKTLKKSKGKIPILANHSTRSQIGWNLEATEDSKGLKVRGKLNFAVQAAVEKYALAKQAAEIGAKMGLSIGYYSRKSTWEGDVRVLHQIDLFEYSIVTFPMNDKASIANIKDERLALATGDLSSNVRDFESHLRDVGFSKQRAKDVASYAFKNQRDVDEKEIVAAIEKVSNIIKV